jgi:hypothetical protein
MQIKTTEVPSHSSQNGNYKENNQLQIVVRMWVKKKPSYTVGGNVN